MTIVDSSNFNTIMFSSLLSIKISLLYYHNCSYKIEDGHTIKIMLFTNIMHAWLAHNNTRILKVTFQLIVLIWSQYLVTTSDSFSVCIKLWFGCKNSNHSAAINVNRDCTVSVAALSFDTCRIIV